jgi:molybdopterin/thiamine biosynthesis adenylyltransferase
MLEVEDADHKRKPLAVTEDRYSRLERYSGFSRTLERWQAASCAVVGLGGLGCGLAQYLARLGVRRLILIDRDTVSRENLGHQLLYNIEQADSALPKAQAAAQVLRPVNPAVDLVPQVAELNRQRIDSLLAGVELVFDGLDNYYTRLLLNDWTLNTGTPYFYAGVVRGEMSARAVIPAVTGCLRCLIDHPPAPGEAPTCAAEGVFPPLLAAANALQLDAANRYLAGSYTRDDDILYSLDVDGWQLRQLRLAGPRADCPACRGRYEYLDGSLDHIAGQDCAADRAAIQLAPLNLDTLARMLEASGEFELKRNKFCLVAAAGALRFTLFPDGRVILSGSDDLQELTRFAAEYLGG